MAKNEIIKDDIRRLALAAGAEFIGFAAVERWKKNTDVPVTGHPQTIWSQANTVIVFGVPLWLPIVEAAPTVLGREQLIVTNKLLEKAAYRLTIFLNRNGYQTVSVPENKSEESTESEAVFSNVWAGYYAGLGIIGLNHTLLTKEYGPRIQLKSLFTELELDGDPLLEKRLCTNCLYCQKICPAQALSSTVGGKTAGNSVACLQHEQRLQKAYCDPCGSCIKVCPVGEDRQLFQSHDFEKYFAESKILAENPAAEEYRDWVHIRNYGSYPLGKDFDSKD